jgi:ABC-type sulfate/molybdate transport systems ATPase subunit
VIEIDLHARRGTFTLDVECRINSEWTVVFGPSGAGKSTLLRLLAGLDRWQGEEPIKGSIVFDGSVMTDSASGVWVKPGQRKCAMVTQQPSLFPHLNVAANVAFGLRALDRVARAERVAEMLKLVDAVELADRLPGKLSGGQQQRVALARALATGPRLLLLDEAFSALDGVASDALLDRLRGWLRDNKAQAVLATHDVSDALAMKAHALLIYEGQMLALGPAHIVLAEERTRLMGRLGGA